MDKESIETEIGAAAGLGPGWFVAGPDGRTQQEHFLSGQEKLRTEIDTNVEGYSTEPPEEDWKPEVILVNGEPVQAYDVYHWTDMSIIDVADQAYQRGFWAGVASQRGRT